MEQFVWSMEGEPVLVQICANGVWGHVSWGLFSFISLVARMQVVCRQLGYSTAGILCTV